MRYSNHDIERYATSAQLHFAAAERAPSIAARLCHEQLGQERLYHVYEAWKAGWR